MAFSKRILVIILEKLFVILILINVEAQTIPSNIIKLGSSLSSNFTCNIGSRSSCWFSHSGLFAFGFYPQANGSAVGIWIVNQTDQTTIVWTANRDDPPLSSMATLELTEQGLELTDNSTMTESKVIAGAENEATSAALLDSGNFVLYLNRSIIWESFQLPTDTILGGQNLSQSQKLESSVSTTDHSSGKFRLVLQPSNTINLGLFPVNSSAAYWAPVPSGRIYSQLSLDFEGSLFLTGSDTDEDMIFVNGSSSSSSSSADGNRWKNGSVIYRATLDADGVFRLYSHHSHNVSLKNNTVSNAVVEWSALDNECMVDGICGMNSYCEIQREKADCYCYPGYAFINPMTRSTGCYRKFTADGCITGNDSREPASSVISSYNITPFENMSWYDSDTYSDVLKEKKACSNSCLDDCNCWAALHTDSNKRCRKYKFPLKNGKRGSFISATAFLKMVHLVNSSTKTPAATKSDATEARKSTILIILGSSLGSIAFLCSLLAISGFLLYKQRVHRYNKLLMENSKLGFGVDFGLHVFSYNELEEATEGFNDELGRGLFGAVYKGNLLYSGQNKAIAVKRLREVCGRGDKRVSS
ncbi:G-type lectin S-receptor-like serine/threonine-protein kinase LECRK2 [Humulus lupulus]|uniref:G-type lectin S-receptor-like serine/threonine-protein kinase LECRK2 n=1 Tax=Humulus lupulus TaxID=3486 RepID=UPI002B40724E|nr:G-type lectin S-receptor-like serine/threonine-protein kinase LECRK2 [Humulus lupulus]